METVQKDIITYRDIDLSSDTIDTLIFSGGGYYGVLYLGFIKFCEEYNLLKSVQSVYGVSVGSFLALFLSLGYTYEEIYKLITQDLELNKFLDINIDNVLNIIDKLGINDGSYFEEAIKNIISDKGLSPYLTFQDLAHLGLGPELNIGFTRNFHNDFFIANSQNSPDMPIWLAIRASIAIPIILTPVIDYQKLDILYDGGVLNNNPIKCYLEKWWLININNVNNTSTTTEKNILPTVENDISKSIVKLRTRDIGIQTGDLDVLGEELDIDQDLNTVIDIEKNKNSEIQNKINNDIEKKPQTKKKYRQHFWCLDIKTLPNNPIENINNLNNINLLTYLIWIIHKIFINQDSSKNKYSRYIQYLDSRNYPQIKREIFDLNAEECNKIIDDTYEKYKKYYNEYLLN